jgi:nucleotide-binding universal stress UspA family protein
VEILSVLCPVDFSDFSRRALDYAITVSRWYRSRLTVMYVHHVPLPSIALFAGMATGPAEGLVLSPADREQLQQHLRSLTRAEDVKGIAVEFSVGEGDVAAEILAEAASADLIVIGTHGRSGFDRLVLGSVAEKVLRKARCSVLTIPRGSQNGTGAVPSLFHHILAAIDFSDVSLHALGYAVSLAEEADAHLTLLHVSEIPKELAQWAEESHEGQEYVERWKASAQKRLKSLVTDDARVYCFVDERVEVGEPYREILRVADERGSRLIVVGAHGAGVVERLFVGSTTERIVRQAQCPVLAVRQIEEKGRPS